MPLAEGSICQGCWDQMHMPVPMEMANLLSAFYEECAAAIWERVSCRQ